MKEGPRTVIGRYKFLQKLGEGGIGVIDVEIEPIAGQYAGTFPKLRKAPALFYPQILLQSLNIRVRYIACPELASLDYHRRSSG